MVFDGVQSLDLAGPWEVFHNATEHAPNRRGYRQLLIGPQKTIRSSSGLVLHTEHQIDSWDSSLDTLIVCGGQGTRTAMHEEKLIDWLKERAQDTRRIASVCTGAFLLAEAGLLDGHRATTHWAWGPSLSRKYPRVQVDTGPIYLNSGKYWTSAGVTAGMDLSLALIEADHGPDLALTIARDLVMYVKRPGGQPQFSAQLAAQASQRKDICQLQNYIEEHLHEDLSIERLAEQIHLSPRHFARIFRQELGTTPGAYVERARVDLARRLLEQTSFEMTRVAHGAGFSHPDTLRRAFIKTINISPSEYRKRFRWDSSATPN